MVIKGHSSFTKCYSSKAGGQEGVGGGGVKYFLAALQYEGRQVLRVQKKEKLL